MTKLNTISEALEDLKAGKMVIVVDDEDRENEGDLVCSAELVTPETINFMAKEARGLICVAITEKRALELELSAMVTSNSALHGTRFTVSIDYLHDTTTGISAFDRYKTVRALTREEVKPSDFGRPGHVFPLVAVEEGVLRRSGHTEAVVDLMNMASLKPVGVLCEILDDDGSMARLPRLQQFAERFGMKIISVKDVISYRFQSESLVTKVAQAHLPTEFGDFRIEVFQNVVDRHEHVALIKGSISGDSATLVRVHSECLTGDIFGSARCDCGAQLHQALRQIEENGSGVLLYMRQEGRGIGLINKIKAYELQEAGLDTVAANEALGFHADPRDYGIGAQILVSLGVRQMRLMTNNPKKRVGLESYGLEVVERVSIEIVPSSLNEKYLSTKRERMGHLLQHL